MHGKSDQGVFALNVNACELEYHPIKLLHMIKEISMMCTIDCESHLNLHYMKYLDWSF